VPVASGAVQNRQGEQGQQGIHEPGTGLENPELKEAGQKASQRIGQVLDSPIDRSSARRSRVANAVKEMERVAENNRGIGDQVRVIARNQNRVQEEAETALQTAQKRSGFSKFFIGPNYGQLKTVEDRLENHTENLAELKELKDQVLSSTDQGSLDEQIQVMEEIKAALAAIIEYE